MIIPLQNYIWKPVTNENDDENAEKDPQEVAENVHEHDRRQSHLWEIDKCFNDFFTYLFYI